MTIITVNSPADRLTKTHRTQLAKSLTDAVLIPEVGQAFEPARMGFQVHFVELSHDDMAIGGMLLSETIPTPDVMTIDVTVMNAAWPPEVRSQVIRNILRELAAVCGLPTPSPTWWGTFRVIDEGNWGGGERENSVDPRSSRQRSVQCGTKAGDPDGAARVARRFRTRLQT